MLTDLWQFDSSTGAWTQKAAVNYDDTRTITRSSGTALMLYATNNYL
jgi:hypothetical protein